jgi:hypothetical protein
LQTLRPQRPPDPQRSSAGPRRAPSAPSSCYGCANVSACISRASALNHLSACRGEAASSSRRASQRHAHRISAVVSVCWRCPGGVERRQFRLAYRP